MKTYQLRLFECDGATFSNDTAQLTDIIEFTLNDPKPANVFGILSQWEEQGKALDAAENAAAREEEQRIPETIRLADASGLTVRVTIEDERFTRVVTVSGCVLESDAVSAVSPYLNSNFLQRVETEVL